MGSRESNENIEHFDLKNHFDDQVTGMSAFDKGIPIDTEIGTLYGLSMAYDADWIIHAGHDEPRDLYFYRMIDRLLKAFAMSYGPELRGSDGSTFSEMQLRFNKKIYALDGEHQFVTRGTPFRFSGYWDEREGPPAGQAPGPRATFQLR